ncbi:hypothetical protein [Legionella birminghamensis]|nr:hypothetical protein [Legionella birminghamensis]
MIDSVLLNQIAQNDPGLTWVNLPHSNLNATDAQHLADALKTNTTIIGIELSENQIGNTAILMINALVNRNKQINKAFIEAKKYIAIFKQEARKASEFQALEVNNLFDTLNSLEDKIESCLSRIHALHPTCSQFHTLQALWFNFKFSQPEYFNSFETMHEFKILIQANARVSAYQEVLAVAITRYYGDALNAAENPEPNQPLNSYYHDLIALCLVAETPNEAIFAHSLVKYFMLNISTTIMPNLKEVIEALRESPRAHIEQQALRQQVLQAYPAKPANFTSQDRFFTPITASKLANGPLDVGVRNQIS